MKNLFVQTAYLGDLFLSIPTLRHFKSLYPEHELVLFCRKGIGRPLKDLGLIDELIEVDKVGKNWGTVRKELRRSTYDILFSVHQSFRTAWIVSSLKAKQKLGYHNWYSNWAYDRVVERPMNWPEVLRQLELLSLLSDPLRAQLTQLKNNNEFKNVNTQRDLSNDKPIPPWASLSIREEVKKQSIDLSQLQIPKNFIALAPGSVWPTKRWIPEGFAELMRSLPQENFILIGSENEAQLCEDIAGSVTNATSLCGQTSLMESLVLLSEAKTLISNDSGSQHMAAAVECPVVSIFGPTVLNFGYRPWCVPARVVEANLGCRPCGIHGSKKCPLGTHACMKKISSKMVLDACQDLWGL